jgi:hypothetical protein
MNIRTAMAEAAFNKKDLFIRKLDLSGKDSKFLQLVLKRGNFGKYFRNTKAYPEYSGLVPPSMQQLW